MEGTWEMLKKQKLTINVETDYAKAAISKIKSILWNQFDSNAEVKSYPFADDSDAEITFYFISTNEQFLKLESSVKSVLGEIIHFKSNE